MPAGENQKKMFRREIFQKAGVHSRSYVFKTDMWTYCCASTEVQKHFWNKHQPFGIKAVETVVN